MVPTGKKRQSEITKDFVDRILPIVATPEDFHQFLHTLCAKVRAHHPEIHEEDTKCWQLIGYLSELRHSERNSNEPSISLQDLDAAVSRLGFSQRNLEEHGYNLSKSRLALKDAKSGRAKRGRPSKLKNTELRNTVSNAIAPHIIESEQVVVLGRGSNRRMVLAKHLTKTKHRIFQENSALQKAMSWSIFHRIMATQFPHIKNPRRRTDICLLSNF